MWQKWQKCLWFSHWWIEKVDPKINVWMGSYELLVNNEDHQMNEKLMIKEWILSYLSEISLKPLKKSLFQWLTTTRTKFSLNRPTGPIQSFSPNVCVSPCLSVPSQITHFLVSCRSPDKGCISNIGLWSNNFQTKK